MQEGICYFFEIFSLLFSKEYLAQNLGKLDKQYSPGGKEMFTGFVRTVILYLVLIVGIRLMGKRQVGELEPSELVLSLIIDDLAAVPAVRTAQRDHPPGQAGPGEMRRNRLTVDELLEELRCQGYADPSVVWYAILETNGQLSSSPRPRKSPHPGPVGPESNRVRASPGPHQRRACAGARRCCLHRFFPMRRASYSVFIFSLTKS